MSDKELAVVLKMRDLFLAAQQIPEDPFMRWMMGELADHLSDLMLAARPGPEAAGTEDRRSPIPKVVPGERGG